MPIFIVKKFENFWHSSFALLLLFLKCISCKSCLLRKSRLYLLLWGFPTEELKGIFHLVEHAISSIILSLKWLKMLTYIPSASPRLTTDCQIATQVWSCGVLCGGLWVSCSERSNYQLCTSAVGGVGQWPLQLRHKHQLAADNSWRGSLRGWDE